MMILKGEIRMDIVFAIIILFAIYGFYSLVNSILCKSKDNNPFLQDNLKFTLETLDCADTIEAVIRWFYGKNGERNYENVKLTIKDLGSKDETLMIVKKLQDEYDNLHIE